MVKRVRESGIETVMASDLRPRLAMAMLFSRLFLVLLLLRVVVVVMLGSSLERCLRVWEAMETVFVVSRLLFWEAMNVCASMQGRKVYIRVLGGIVGEVIYIDKTVFFSVENITSE